MIEKVNEVTVFSFGFPLLSIVFQYLFPISRVLFVKQFPFLAEVFPYLSDQFHLIIKS
jgi:hypothetical protein